MVPLFTNSCTKRINSPGSGVDRMLVASGMLPGSTLRTRIWPFRIVSNRSPGFILSSTFKIERESQFDKVGFFNDFSVVLVFQFRCSPSEKHRKTATVNLHYRIH